MEASVTTDDGSAPDVKDEDDLPMGFYIVDRILDRRIQGQYREYLVKWKDYNSSENSWVAQEDFVDQEMVEDYERHYEETASEKPQFAYFLVEAILSHRGGLRCREYPVKWEGSPPSENSWVEDKDFSSMDMILDYEDGILDSEDE